MAPTLANLVSFVMTGTIVAATLLASCKEAKPDIAGFGDRFRYFFVRFLAGFIILAGEIWLILSNVSIASFFERARNLFTM